MKSRNLITFMAGAAVGAGLLWLFSSDEGKELLTKLKDKASHLKDELEKDLKEVADVFEDLKENR